MSLYNVPAEGPFYAVLSPQGKVVQYGSGDATVPDLACQVLWFDTEEARLKHAAMASEIERLRLRRLRREAEGEASDQAYGGKEENARRLLRDVRHGVVQEPLAEFYPWLAIDIELRGWAPIDAALRVVKAVEAQALERERRRVAKRLEAAPGD